MTNYIIVEYGGNMGNTMKEVEECIQGLFHESSSEVFAKIRSLKGFKKEEESGSPDYLWYRKFHFTSSKKSRMEKILPPKKL